jgi:hypothetical protein
MSNILSKTCSVCHREKALAHFSKNYGFKDGLLNRCNLCKSAASKVFYKNNKEKILAHVRAHARRNKDKVKNRVLKKYFGITLSDYNSRLEKQANCCAICNEQETHKANNGNKIRSLAVDHCHKTGKIRGLLCTKCNTAIGLLRDDVLIMGRAMEYIAQYLMDR